MAETHKPRFPTSEDIDATVGLRAKHAAEIGRIAIEWNSLHDTLGKLFAEVVAPERPRVAMAAWGAVASDRSKREMLRSAAIWQFREDESEAKWLGELEWLLGQINPLEDRRNNAVHAPYGFLIEEGAVKFTPFVWSGNPRAEKLRDKDLSMEFSSCADHIRLLIVYVRDLLIMRSEASRTCAWPERPRLPRPAQAQAKRS